MTGRRLLPKIGMRYKVLYILGGRNLNSVPKQLSLYYG